jgi:hypothetical protein
MQVHAGGLKMLNALGCSEHASDVNRSFGATVDEDLAPVGE